MRTKKTKKVFMRTPFKLRLKYGGKMQKQIQEKSIHED